MAIQITTNINVDFYDKKYILISAKQLDKNSRFLSVSCYNHGEPYQLYAGEHAAYIRYKKPDGYSVFNFCEINNKGKILVELTEQMLVTDGICYADLVIVNKGDAQVNADTGEIVAIDNASILSTMTFCIDVSEIAVLNSEIESSYEYNGLNEALEKAEAEYTEVIQLSKSYAVGNAGGIRNNEDKDNSKYYYEQSLKYAGESEKSYLSADASATKAEEYMHNALVSEQNAQTYMSNAKSYMDNAKTSEQNAYASENNAKTSETNASISEQNALSYMNDAEGYKDTAYNYAIVSQRYAVGGTNTVSGEDTDNSKYYYQLSLENANSADESEANALASASAASDSETNAKTSEQNAFNSANEASTSAANASDSAMSASNSESSAKGYATTAQNSMNSAIDSATSASTSATNAYNYYLQTEAITNGLNGAFLPKGTISYSELAILKENNAVGIGYLYNISDNFVTDETFRMGAGVEYTAGTNVYYTADGYWDCLVGTTVTGVKGNNESVYRKGNVNLTAENIGAISSADIATVDEVKGYLGIE